MVKVINIQPEYEAILPFLFPNYAITDSLAVTSKFISHRTVKSKAEREALDWQFADGVFISAQIFDELWDEEKIKEECIEFSRKTFKNRKKTLTTTKETFIQDCINFIFGIPSDEEETSIMELFDSFGSGMFPAKFIQLTEKYSYQQLQASMTTFVSKLKKDSTSPYYKKKAFLFADKIDANLITAIDNYNQSIKALGLPECKFFIDIVK